LVWRSSAGSGLAAHRRPSTGGAPILEGSNLVGTPSAVSPGISFRWGNSGGGPAARRAASAATAMFL